MTRRHASPLLLPILATLTAFSILFGSAVRANDLQPKKAAPLPAAFDKPAPEGLDDLKAMERQVQQVVEKVIPCTVNIRDVNSQGSGVIVSEDGYVLTAGHVSRESGRDVILTLHDGRRVKAKTLGANHNIDSGFLKITEAGKWPYVEMGKSADLKPGQWVITTGHPGGYKVGRSPVVRFGRVLKTTPEFIRTDCTIVGGDSGGPLFDITGKVVGIHSRIANLLSANIHVPVDTYRATWERLVKGDVWGNAFLGFSAERKGACKVTEVATGSPAAKAGLEVGDVVVALDGKKVEGFQDFRTRMQETNVGVKVVLDVERDDEVVKLTVTVGKREGTRLPEALGDIIDKKVQKGNDQVLAAFRGVEDRARPSVVRVLCDGKDVALGTVVAADGFILTKNSELKGKITCKLPDGKEEKATVVGIHDTFDLAMLKVEAKGLTPVQWDDSKAAPVGHWVTSAGTSERPVGIGVVSVGARKGGPIPQGGYLGILLADAEGAIKISEVMPDTAAAKAGLKANDLLLSLGGKTYKDVQGFIDAVSRFKPGEEVTLRVKRGSEEKELKAKLGTRPPDGPPSRSDQQNQFGTTLSSRRAGFPMFLQHDTALTPQQCGGPVLDLDGKAIGINIARAGRVESYAIPSEEVRPLLAELMSGKLAPKEVKTEAQPKKEDVKETKEKTAK